ncbi:unnamed protein product, partial [Iphiclides podalirius]
MTLIGAILKKVKSKDSVRKYNSPPPEMEGIPRPKKKRHIDKYAHVNAVVDCKPPIYDCGRLFRNERKWRQHIIKMAVDNARILMAIRMAHFNRGKVDSHWKWRLPTSKVYYANRVNFLTQLQRNNQAMYKLIMSTGPRVQSTRSLEVDWRINRREMLQRAQNKFVLFSPVPEETVEDSAFRKPRDVTRPRARLTIQLRGGAVVGELKVELFEDVCPNTCRLFLELLDGESGYGYVGTSFFRKVPGLYWRGGDVVYDNGFGCYAQRGRNVPIGAETYHFPHSMSGLLSMRVTRDNEVCGNFNITFKPLPQFDLRNVVFGKVIRPCKVYDAIRELGNTLSTYPVVEIAAARRLVHGKWRNGAKNTKLPL